MKYVLKQKLGKMYIATSVGLTVVMLIILKLFAYWLEVDVIVTSSLMSSIISGTTFITGFLLAGVLADYKEVEKIPAEIRSSLESILKEGEALYRKDRNFDVNKIKEIIIKFVQEFEHGLSDVKDHSHLDHALSVLSELDFVFDDMEARGVPPNYMTRIKSEQSLVKKMLLRVYHIQKTKFIPSVSVLVESLALLVILLFIFLEMKSYSDLIIFGILSFLILYTMRLIHVLEKPFRKGKDDTQDDVSIFLLRELSAKLRKE